MKPINIMVCSSNRSTEQEMAQTLNGAGAKAQTSRNLLDGLAYYPPAWDFLLVDLDGINDFLRDMLPIVRQRYPHLPAIGIRGKNNRNISGLELGLGSGLELDAYLSEIPEPEELMIHFPQAAAHIQPEFSN